MELIDTVADELAAQSLALAEETGNDEIVAEVSKVIGSSSTTLQEAFLTAVRVRRAAKQARELLARFADGTAVVSQFKD